MNKPINLFAELNRRDVAKRAKTQFLSLIQPEQYVGEVYSISYNTALVQIHDFHRRQVGGIPSLSFLIATRLTPSIDPNSFDYTREDSSIILLRVMDAAPLPNQAEAERIRVETAQKVSGEVEVHWDQKVAMDAATKHVLSFAGIKCRVIGTFYLDVISLEDAPGERPVLCFGSDISNYYPNEGLTVYKPNSNALETIINYRDLTRPDLLHEKQVAIGEVRYASTNRAFQGVTDVKVNISPADLLGQKTALFGMTRTGKSNTTKVIAESVFNLRYDDDKPLRIGQIIFDPNGEYANENIQDENKQKNPSALKNIGEAHPKDREDDVVTYGILPHPNDPGRKLMLINFYDEEMLQVGKEIINNVLAEDTSKYIQNFCQVSFEGVDKKDYDTDGEYYSASTRYNRRVLAYRALLKRAGFPVSSKIKPATKGLFSADLLNAMKGASDKDKKKEQAIKAAAETLEKPSPSWDSLGEAFEGLFYFLSKEEYVKFNAEYIKGSTTGESWADSDLERVLEMFAFRKGANLIGRVSNQHTSETITDFADDIYKDLVMGKLVIVDQSSGDAEVNDSSARRIMTKIFTENQKVFREGEPPPDILVYVEEAHNLLPSGTDMDLKDIWVRTAKEGAKYHIGMVYTTQEVSSIQRNILKNTANWFIGHLNNTDETKELRKYYDFSDFESSILRAQDRGFLRVKTLSNLFVVSVQVRKFEIGGI